jgi:hypothetical protein
MKKWIVCSVIFGMLLMNLSQAETLFSDTYTRANNTDIDAVSDGMSGTLSPIAYVECFEGSGVATSIQIASNQLNIAYGPGMANAYLNHNFTDAAILTAGGFSISIDIVSIAYTTTDLANRYGGFGVGMTQAEAAAAGDITDNDADSTTMRGGGDNVAVCDLFVDVALDNNLRFWSNGSLKQTINVGAAAGTLKVDFSVPDFNAGSLVTAAIYFNKVLQASQSFQWDNTGANYIGLSGRTPDAGVFVDNLSIETLTQIPFTILLSQTDSGTAVKEGDYSDELILSVTSDPLDYPVTIDIIDALNPDQVILTPSQVIFTTDNWQSPQIVTVAAIDDNDMERETHEATLNLTVTADSASSYYGYVLPDVVVAVHDNDCGTWGFNPADFNLDCQVNLEDFSIFVQEWIGCSFPAPECQDFRP